MDVSLILPFADVETAIASVPQIKLANLDPQSIEFMERDIVDYSAAFTGNSVFPTVVNGKEAGAYILVTLVGDSEAELTAKMDRLGELAEKCGAYDTLVVWTDGLKKDVWAARSAFLTVIEADTKLLDELDVVVPVDRIAEFLVYTRAAGKAEGIAIRNFGHAGDGNLHIYTCANDMELDEFKKQVDDFMTKSYDKATEMGGLVSGEHGIGYAKTAVGDKYVYEYMAKNGCRIGGEQSGHIIFSKYASTGDGILTSLKMMEVMLAKKMPMSKLAEPLKIYPQVLENVRVTDKKAAQNDPAVQEAVKAVAEALGDTGRILVRESGTEPLVRVMVEAPDHDICQKYVSQVVEVIKSKGYAV
mgnify:CR=1 FL=1